MERLVSLFAAAGILTAGLVSAQGQITFKLGTFERAGRPFVGVVLRDSVVIDLAAANAALASPSAKVASPTDMKDLIARYEAGVRDRIVQIVTSVNSAASGRPAYVYDLKALKTLPPIMYPTAILNVALNYVEHSREMAGLNSGPPPIQPGGPLPGAATKDTTSMPGIWERQANDGRWNPYMFLKSASAVIADGNRSGCRWAGTRWTGNASSAW